MASFSPHRTCSFAARFIPAFLVGMLLAGSTVQAAKPEAVLRGTFVYPRSDITATESLVWRGQLTVRHQVTQRVSWHFLGEITPATLTRPAGLRLYSGQIQAGITPDWKMTLGRQFLWNNLQTTRFDGIALGRHTGTFRNSRQLTLYAGKTPDTELRTDYGEAGKPVAGGMFQLTNGSSRYGLQAWATHMTGTLNFYLGGSLRRRLGSRLTQVADLAFNLTAKNPEKIRLRTQVHLTQTGVVYFQYRFAGQLSLNPYPWVPDTTFAPRQNLSAGAHWSPLKGLQLGVSISQRLGNHDDRYLRAQLAWGGLMFTWQANAQSIYEGHYVQLSGRHHLSGHLQAGGSIGAGSYTLFDENSDAVSHMTSAGILDAAQAQATRSSLAATFWLQGSSNSRFSYRLFTQFTRNRLFNQDGRVGLQVIYAF